MNDTEKNDVPSFRVTYVAETGEARLARAIVQAADRMREALFRIPECSAIAKQFATDVGIPISPSAPVSDGEEINLKRSPACTLGGAHPSEEITSSRSDAGNPVSGIGAKNAPLALGLSGTLSNLETIAESAGRSTPAASGEVLAGPMNGRPSHSTGADIGKDDAGKSIINRHGAGTENGISEPASGKAENLAVQHDGAERRQTAGNDGDAVGGEIRQASDGISSLFNVHREMSNENEQRATARDYLKASLLSVETMLAGLSHDNVAVRQGLEDRRCALERELAELDAMMRAERPDRGWLTIGEIALEIVDGLRPRR